MSDHSKVEQLERLLRDYYADRWTALPDSFPRQVSAILDGRILREE